MHARTIIVLAMRNLRRQLRRTMLTAAVMVIGGALLILSFALGDDDLGEGLTRIGELLTG